MAEKSTTLSITPSLTMITRDPFCKPWKRSARVLGEAIRRGWEVVVAMDSRSCEGCRTAMPGVSYTWTPTRDSCDEQYDAIVRRTHGSLVLMVADDEEPSPSLWDFAEHPPALANYAVKLVTPTPDGRVYTLGTEIQARLVNPKTWRWVGGIAGTDEIRGAAYFAGDLILWHFATCAPRDVREAKLANYKTLGADDHYGERHIYERRPDAIIPMSKALRAQFP